ncbi:MAG TPA: hemerythrin domain-containing protein [Dehalococcoidia bacterium]|nr:hemerythrin domain-containing protein [Dehalococcoidia bacterium]
MSRPTELLKQDHRVIERMLKVLATTADRLDKGQEVDPSVFDRSLDFIRQFADYNHHGKEEDILFNAIEQAGIPKHGGPVGVMLEEHDEGRKGVQKMVQGLERYRAGDKSAAAQIVRGARDYVYVLRSHIPKEDDILYPLADEVVPPKVHSQMQEQFEKVEEERMGAKRPYYLQMVDDLEKEIGLR